MEFNQFAYWLLCGLLTVIATVLGWFFTQLIIEIKKMRIEMNDLNNKLSQVVTNQTWHERDILRLDNRLNELEHEIRR